MTKTPRKSLKVGQDMLTPVSRVYWTEEERTILLDSIIEGFRTKKVPMDQWGVTNRSLMLAQIEYLPESRYREFLTEQEVYGFHTTLRDYVVKHETEEVLCNHRLYISTHGVSPIDHAYQLKGELEAKVQALRNQGEKIEENNTAIAAQQREIDRLNNELLIAQQEVQTLKDRLAFSPVLVNNKAAGKLPMFLVTNKISPESKAKLNALNPEIIYLEPKDGMTDIKRKATGRVVYTVEGQLNTSLIKQAKTSAQEYHHLSSGGISTVVAAVTSRMQQHHNAVSTAN